MSWGTELWDQFDNLSSHTQKGIDFLEKFSHFVKDRCSVEVDYATKLRKLVKNYQPRNKKDDDDNMFSTNRAFRKVMGEINDLAGQHEIIAETLQTQVIKELSALIKDIREERKKYFSDGVKLVQSFNNQKTILDRSKKNYEKAFRESERSVDIFNKVNEDINASKAEVERQRINMQIKSQLSEAAKNEYADQLQRTNEAKRSHYYSLMPNVFRHIQDFEDRRIKSIKTFFCDVSTIEKNVIPIIVRCIDGIAQAANTINEKEDSQLVVEKYKSGFTPPEDIEFEDLSRQINTSVGRANSGPDISNSLPIVNGLHTSNRLTETLSNAANTIKGTVSLSKNKKRAGLFSLFSGSKNGSLIDSRDDFSYLPPNQQKKRLKGRIDEIDKLIIQQTSIREGLMKMKNAFEDFPSCGDPMTVECQLTECNSNLEKLRVEIDRYRQILANVNNNQSNNNIDSSNVIKTNGIDNDDGDFSRSDTDSTTSNRTANNNEQDNNKNHLKPSVPEISQLNYENSNSPESGLGMSHTSLPNIDDSDVDHSDGVTNNIDNNLYTNDDYYIDPKYLQVLGICKALYPFQETGEGSIPIEQNEELYVIELDQGDGWTRVRRLRDENVEEGFVPTTYIEIHLYNEEEIS